MGLCLRSRLGRRRRCGGQVRAPSRRGGCEGPPPGLGLSPRPPPASPGAGPRARWGRCCGRSGAATAPTRPGSPPHPTASERRPSGGGGPAPPAGTPSAPRASSAESAKSPATRDARRRWHRRAKLCPPPELRRNTAPVRRSEHLGSTKSLNGSRQRNTLPRSVSLEQVLQRPFAFDLTYVTERIICLRFPGGLEEPRYRRHLREVATMLASRHRHHYTIFNLSEKRRDITRLNPKVQDFGWPDLHAPPLDKLCSICKAMEGWLRAHPQHVAVLHCKGSKGKTGVIVAAYMHYSKVSASADQALSTLTMRKFCEEKVAAALQPSQRSNMTTVFGHLQPSQVTDTVLVAIEALTADDTCDRQTGSKILAMAVLDPSYWLTDVPKFMTYIHKNVECIRTEPARRSLDSLLLLMTHWYPGEVVRSLLKISPTCDRY
ncbi:tensin-2-like [Chroicocephalus ridibundus]|uniref:tensin-2-like n=1 Tax=Chroicocephalus ridibundus TaxID=1192867 RepID=UPI002FDD4C20